MAAILILEDDPVLAELLRSVLEDDGHRAVVASSLTEAAAIVGPEAFDLLLADLVDFDLRGGPGAVQALRELAGLRPILLCSGQPTAPKLVGSDGISGVLGKPFDVDVLLTSVRRALEAAGRAGRGRV